MDGYTFFFLIPWRHGKVVVLLLGFGSRSVIPVWFIRLVPYRYTESPQQNPHIEIILIRTLNLMLYLFYFPTQNNFNHFEQKKIKKKNLLLLI